MNQAALPLPGCPIPEGTSSCLDECRASGRCRASRLLLTDGRTLVGRSLGIIGETLRFHAVWPEKGPVLVPFLQVEAVGLLDCLRACTDPSDGPGLLRIAVVSAARGMVDAALRELDRALEADPSLAQEVARRRTSLVEEAAERGLRDAQDHLAAGRPAHARAALEEVLTRFPASAAAAEARRVSRSIAAAV